METFLIILFWAFCGTLGFGATWATFHRKFSFLGNPNDATYKRHVSLGIISKDSWKNERFGDIMFASFIFFLGPIGLIAATICSPFFKYGFKFNLTPDDLK